MLRSSGPRAGRCRNAAVASLRCWPSGVRGGIRPLGGSTISEVRRVSTTLVPRSIQKLL